MKFRPSHDRVVIDESIPRAKTAGGSIIPDTARRAKAVKVIAVENPAAGDESGKLIPLASRSRSAPFSAMSARGSNSMASMTRQHKESDIMGVWSRPSQAEGRPLLAPPNSRPDDTVSGPLEGRQTSDRESHQLVLRPIVFPEMRLNKKEYY